MVNKYSFIFLTDSLLQQTELFAKNQEEALLVGKQFYGIKERMSRNSRIEGLTNTGVVSYINKKRNFRVSVIELN